MLVIDDTLASIDADIPCRLCGYDLRGLRRDGRCPECGDAVTLSIAAASASTRRLTLCDPVWLRSLIAGCVAMVVATCLSQVPWQMVPQGAVGDLIRGLGPLTLAWAGILLLTRPERFN